MQDKVALIHANVKMPDVLRALGISNGARKGRMTCPLHQGKNRTSFQYDDTHFRCHSCGAHGDVIAFVQEYDNLDFKGALEQINEMFHLWTSGKRLSINQKKRMQSAKYHRKMKKTETEEIKSEYESALNELHRLEANLIKKAPKSPDDIWDDEFVEACHKISYQRYLVDVLEKGEDHKC